MENFNIPHRQQWVGKLPEFPIYGDREGSFQADCMFLPRVQGYVGCLCLISDNRKIAWAEAFKGNTPDEGGQRTKRIRAGQMFPYFVKCVEEIEKGSMSQSCISRANVSRTSFIGISSNLP